MLPKIKNIIIFTIVAIIIILVYIFFFSGGEDQSSLISSSPSLPVTTNTNTDSVGINLDSQADDALSQSFLSLLLGVQSITLNDSIFKPGSAFFSLYDSSIILVPDGTEGRANPFAPIGSDPTLVTPSSAPASDSASESIKPN